MLFCQTYVIHLVSKGQNHKGLVTFRLCAGQNVLKIDFLQATCIFCMGRPARFLLGEKCAYFCYRFTYPMKLMHFFAGLKIYPVASGKHLISKGINRLL